MIEEINKLAQQQHELAWQAYRAYLPVVEDIEATQTNDTNQISLVLDYMLGFCFDAQMLTLYRRLCRYLYAIHPKTAVFYVNAYREMWDEEGNQFGNNKEANR